MKAAKARRRRKKKHHWTLPTVLGLAVSVVGAVGVIELRPQITVAPLGELDTNQPFSAPFEITNSGYLKVHIESVIVDAYNIEYPRGIRMADNIESRVPWDNFDLDRGESKTIFTRFVISDQLPIKADIVFSVEYEFFWKRWRRLYRFEGVHGDRWQWSKQPIGNIEDEVNKRIDEVEKRPK